MFASFSTKPTYHAHKAHLNHNVINSYMLHTAVARMLIGGGGGGGVIHIHVRAEHEYMNKHPPPPY